MISDRCVWIWIKRHRITTSSDKINISIEIEFILLSSHIFVRNEEINKIRWFSRRRNPVVDWIHLCGSCIVDTCVSKWRALRQHHFRRLSYFWLCRSHRNPSFASFLVHLVSYPLNRHQKYLDDRRLQHYHFLRRLVSIVTTKVCFSLFHTILI